LGAFLYSAGKQKGGGAMLKEFWERNKVGRENEVRVLHTDLHNFEILPFIHGGIIGLSLGVTPHYRHRLAFWSPLQNPPRGDQYDSRPVIWVDELDSLAVLSIEQNRLLLGPWECIALKFVLEVANGK